MSDDDVRSKDGVEIGEPSDRRSQICLRPFLLLPLLRHRLSLSSSNVDTETFLAEVESRSENDDIERDFLSSLQRNPIGRDSVDGVHFELDVRLIETGEVSLTAREACQLVPIMVSKSNVQDPG